MLQDVWPDNAVQSGLIKQGGLLYRFFELWQRYVYKKADKIICISDDMKDFIAGKGVGEDKIEVIYNWGYSDEMVDISWDDNAFVKKYRLNRDMFYAIYAGNIGKMQNVEIVVNAAKVLQDRSNIQFLIIGDGVRKKQIQEMANGLKNITMLPMQPAELATHIYSAASVNLIPLVAGGTKTAMPSKTGVVLACNKPVIFTFGKNAKFNNLLVSYHVGCSVDPDDEKALATEIERIYQTKTQLPSMSKSSEFLKDIFSRSKNKEKYVFALRDTCNV